MNIDTAHAEGGGTPDHTEGDGVKDPNLRNWMKVAALGGALAAVGAVGLARNRPGTREPHSARSASPPEGSASPEQPPFSDLHETVLGNPASPRKEFSQKEEYTLEVGDPVAVDIYREHFEGRTFSEQRAQHIIRELSVIANLFSDRGEDSFKETAREFFRQLRERTDQIGVPFEIVANVMLIGARNTSDTGKDGSLTTIQNTNEDINISKFQAWATRLQEQRAQDVFRGWIAGLYSDHGRPNTFSSDTRHLLLLKALAKDPHRYEEKLPMKPWQVVRLFNPTTLYMDTETMIHVRGIMRNPELFKDEYPEVLRACERMMKARNRLEAERDRFEEAAHQYVDQNYERIYEQIINGESSIWEEVRLTDPPSPHQVVNYTEFWRQYNRLITLRHDFLEIDLVDTESHPGVLAPRESIAARELAEVLGITELLDIDPAQFIERIREEDAISLACQGTMKHFREDILKTLPEDLPEDERKHAVVREFVKDQILNPDFIEYANSKALTQVSERFSREGQRYKKREMQAFGKIAEREHDMSLQIRVNTASIAANLDAVERLWGSVNLRQKTKFDRAKEIALYVFGTAMLHEIPTCKIITDGTTFAKNPFFDILSEPEAVLRPIGDFIKAYNEIQRRGVSTLHTTDFEAGFRSPSTLLSGRMSTFTPSLFSPNGPLLQLTSIGRYSYREPSPNTIGRTEVTPEELHALQELIAQFDERPDYNSGMLYGQSIANSLLSAILAELVTQQNFARQQTPETDPFSSTQ